jgi:hypothetical protein
MIPIQKRFDKVRLELEPNKSFLLRPTILLLFEKALLEPGDYLKLEEKKSKSPWHKLCYENAKFLIDEGVIELTPVNIPYAVRSIIKKTGEDLASFENNKLKYKLLKHAWESFDNYISIKTFYLRSNQNLLIGHLNFRNNISKYLKKYSDAEPSILIDDFDKAILRQILWKTHASIETAVKENSALYMALEYRPFITYLLKNLTFSNSDSASNSIEEIEKIDKLLIFISTLNFPSTKIESENEKRAFIKLRKKSWKSFNELCQYLNEIIYQSENKDFDFIKSIIENQSHFALETIQEQIKKMESISIIGTLISRVVLHCYGLPPAFGKEPIDFAKNRIIDSKFLLPQKLKKRIPWYQTAAESFSCTELQLIKGEISKYKNSGQKIIKGDYWFDNPDELPWYVESKKI